MSSVDSALQQWAIADQASQASMANSNVATGTSNVGSSSSSFGQQQQQQQHDHLQQQQLQLEQQQQRPLVPGTRQQLEAEVLRLRQELTAVRRGAHLTERVD